MPRKKATTDRSAQVARIAWLATFVLPLFLATLLLAVKSAQAEPASPNAVLLSVEEEFESGEEGESAEESCIEAEEEFEAGELGEAELEQICEEAELEPAANGATSNRCPLRSVRAHAVAKHGSLKLTVGYTAREAVTATVEIRRGSARIASVRRHLGRSGVLRIVKRLGRLRTKRIVVRIHALASSQRCDRVQTKTIQFR